MFGSHHGSADSTTTSKTWGADTIEQILMSGQRPSWYYEDETLAPINPQMQQILDYELSENPFINARQVMARGGHLIDTDEGMWQELAGISGQDILTKWRDMTATGYNNASQFMQNQDKAIEDHVNAMMGSELAQSAEVNGNQAAYTSGALNQKSAIVAQSAESMETQESAMAAKIARAAATGSASAINSGLRVKVAEATGMGSLGLGVIGTGAKMFDKALNNAWQAGSFETAYNQKQNNVNRHNDMINNNLPMIEEMQWFEAMLQAQGIDTSSTTHTKY